MTWYCCAPLRYSDEQPLVAVAVRLHESPPKSPKSRPWREAEIAAMVAMVAKKSEQGPPNPEQGCFHCRTPEPTAGPSICMCRWCTHKKSREKMPSGSRAAVRKSLGRVRLIYPLQYPGLKEFSPLAGPSRAPNACDWLRLLNGFMEPQAIVEQSLLLPVAVVVEPWPRAKILDPGSASGSGPSST